MENLTPHAIYRFLSGPALWFSMAMFLGGLALRLGCLYRLSRRKDPVIYNHASLRWGLKSILFWLVPWATVSMRSQPVFTGVVFVFHFCLLAVPLFLNAHNVLWDEAFGVSLWSLPDAWADGLTLVFLAATLFVVVRRIVRPEVRILTSAWDYSLMALTALPFLTGFLAYHQIGPYELMLPLHIGLAEILLIVIPFSKLAHMLLFFFSRAFIGFELGARRGARSW
jgi:nitrate reductase gamma subunit